MLSTIIIDAYEQTEKKQIADALEDICSSSDNYGWSSAGLYCYWDYYTKEILYLGLAVDLTRRFKEHNNFFPKINPNFCKKEQIKDYFSKNKKIGFTIVVQSSLSQPIISSNRQSKELNDASGISDIKLKEGEILTAFKDEVGKYPIWNKINGSTQGQNSFKNIKPEIFKALTNNYESYLVSRSSLRELSSNPLYVRYEIFLHAFRIQTAMFGHKEAIRRMIDTDSDTEITLNSMEEKHYMNKNLLI